MGSSGRFVWYELATPDMEAAKKFYASVAGWSTGAAPALDSVYSLFLSGNEPVAGVMPLPPEAMRAGAVPQWLGYIGAGDVDAIAAEASRLGGTLEVPPVDVPNISRFSVIADPQMARFALIKGRESTEQHHGKPWEIGQFGWNELFAPDLERAFVFYSALFGWKKMEAHAGPMGTYQEFAAGTDLIGGLFSGADMPPISLWLYYVNVGNIKAAVKRVQAGGGQLHYGPVTIPSGSVIAHCTDPHGAVFGLMEKRVRIAVACYQSRDPS